MLQSCPVNTANFLSLKQHLKPCILPMRAWFLFWAWFLAWSQSLSVSLPPFPLCFTPPPHPFQTGLELHTLRFFKLSSLQSNKVLPQQATDLQGGPDEYQVSLVTFVDVLHWRSTSRKIQRMCLPGKFYPLSAAKACIFGWTKRWT